LTARNATPILRFNRLVYTRGNHDCLPEIALFRDSSVKQAWAYDIVMMVIGACYLGYLLATPGKGGLAMPGTQSIGAELDAEAAKD
jgi:hypothetical protein